MTDYIAEFLDFMAVNGCSPANSLEIIADDKPHYFQIADDKPSQKRGSYCLKVEDNIAVGWLRSHKFGETYNYVSKSAKKLSAPDRAAFLERQKEAKLKREQQESQEWETAANSAKSIWNIAIPAIEHPYLSRKQIQAHGTRIHNGNLLVPLYADNKLWSLQTIDAEGNKLYAWYDEAGELISGRKKGCFFPMATRDEDKSVILLAEGFSTSASIREATNLPVICCLDSGNLRPVAEAFRLKYPESKFVLCSDNDRFGKDRKGRPYNIGIIKAQEAAGIIGAGCIWPEFPEDDITSSDFNDAAVLYGADYVTQRIISAILKIVPAISEPDNNGGEAVSIPDMSVQSLPTTFYENEYEEEQRGDFGLSFKILGYNEGTYYYFPFHGRQIVALAPSAHSIQNLLQLDTLEAWQDKHGGDKVPSSKIALLASNALMSVAKDRGVFQEADRVRGCGVWEDEGRFILNAGDALYIKGQKKRFSDVKSEFTYVAAQRLLVPSDNPLTAAEAYKLRNICESVTWDNKLSGSLLAGWLVIAPICAALSYRPHIYLTGEAESGKSTVMDLIIKKVVGKISVNVDGGTTEPAIRDQMNYDARPLIFDEAEPSPSMDAVIGLSRKASTGATVKKFGQKPFKARFCACFGAINPPVNKTADESRISFLVIKKNRRQNAPQEYQNLLKLIDETITSEFSSRLLARTLANIDTLMQNIQTFQKSARYVIGSPRAAQQIGTMLAGLYLLSKTDLITPEAAETWLKAYDWSEHTIIGQDTDPVRLAQHIASSLIKVSLNGQIKEVSMADLIDAAHRVPNGPEDKILRNHGIAVKDNFVDIANRSPNFSKLLKDTEWEMKWSRTLSDIQGAQKMKVVYFARGFKTSAVRLPISIFIEDEPSAQSEMNYGHEEEIPFNN